MKTLSSHIKTIALAGLLIMPVLWAVSCSSDEPDGSTIVGQGEVVIQFTLHIDGLGTRGSGTMQGNEQMVNELNLLIFHNDLLYEQIALPVSSLATKFAVKTQTTEEEATFWLIANSSDAFRGSGIRLGDTKESIRKALTSVFISSGTENGLFPMWGETVLSSGIRHETVITEPISLLRAIARVDLQLDNNFTIASEVNDISDFKLLSAYIFQANDRIQVIPEPSYLTADKKKVTSASIPAGAVADVSTEEVASGPDGRIANLYLPESLDADAVYKENATCLMLECQYQRAGVTRIAYYRLYFENENGYFEVLRNKHYKANILQIRGYGTTDPDGAVEHDMDVSILEWDEEEIGGTEDFMSVSGRIIDLFFYKNSTGTVSVKSDLNLYDVQFCDAQGNVTLPSPGQELIESSRFRIEIEDDGKTIRASALVDNEADNIYTEYVLVTSGNIKFVVTVNQGTRRMRDFINVFNLTGLMGNLGDEVYNIAVDFDNPMSTYGRGLQKILKNKNNFGWEGIVPFEGYIISGLPYATPLSPELLDLFQVIFMPVVTKSASGLQEAVSGEEARNVIKWVRNRDDRVLIIVSALNSNIALLDELGIKVNTYSPNYYSTYNFAVNAPPDIINGPFGKLEGNLAIAGPGVQSYIKGNENPGITPILVNNADENQIVLGVNLDERIVFCSNYWLNTLRNDGGVVTNNGVISNTYDRLLANLWAWIAETVLKDEHDPDVTL